MLPPEITSRRLRLILFKKCTDVKYSSVGCHVQLSAKVYIHLRRRNKTKIFVIMNHYNATTFTWNVDEGMQIVFVILYCQINSITIVILIVDCFHNKSLWVKIYIQQRRNLWTWGGVLPMTYLIIYDNHVSALLSIQSNSEFLICNSAHYKYKKIKFSGSFLILV